MLARTRRTLVTAAAALALLGGAGAPVARAQGVADEAELHFRLGADRYQHGDFLGALEHFLASNRLSPNRNVVYDIARSFEQLRRYADAHRAYVQALEGETEPRAIRDVTAALERIAPSVALLSVVTSPPGATLYIDRKDLGSHGRAPRPLAVLPGRYRVLAELDGYEPAASGVIEARLGQTARVELSLPRIVGAVHVEVEGPPGALVRADDERAAAACTAPCELALPPGAHQIYVSREGWEAAPRAVVVVARRAERVVVRLRARTGSLVVSTDEPGAQISIGGRTYGFTPTVIPAVPAGPQTVRLTQHGYLPVERAVTIKADQEAILRDVELAPIREVTAVSRVAERLEDAPSSVSIIDRQELRAFGYPTIAEALRGTRGVYLSNDRAYSQIGVRGIGQPNDYGNRVLVLQDGASLNDNLLNSSYVGSDGRADLHDVERIEVVRGPGSLLYGTGAFSGVVNLVTRPRDEPDGVHVGIGTYDDAVLRGRAGFHYTFGRDSGVWASASAARSDGRDLAITLKDPSGVVQTAHGVDSFTSGGTAGRVWSGPFTMQWFFHTREQHIPVGAYATQVDDLRTQFTDSRWMAEARFEPRLSDRVELMTRVHANRYTFHGDYAQDPAPTAPKDEHYYGTWFGAEARVAVTPIPSLRLTAGAEGQADPQATLEGCCKGSSGTPYLNVEHPYVFGAMYALGEASPWSWLRVSAGARLDAYSTFGLIGVPRVAFIFKPHEGTTIKLMGGRAFRAPSVYEQYYTDGISQVPAVDRARGLTLGPESVYSGELEVSQRFRSDWIALVAGHVSTIEGLIETIDDKPGNDNVLRYANNPPVLAVGGEAEIRRDWRKGWMLSANYGYQSARVTAKPGVDSRLTAYPEHTASLRGVAPVVAELVSAGVRLTVEAPRRIDATSSAETPAALIGDVTVSGNIRAIGLRYVVGIYNVADVRYALPVVDSFKSATMPQNGRTFLLDLVATYP